MAPCRELGLASAPSPQEWQEHTHLHDLLFGEGALDNIGSIHHGISADGSFPGCPSCCGEWLCTGTVTCTLVPMLNFACRPMARKETKILSWARILTPTWRFREMKMGLSGTCGSGDRFGHIHLLTLLPAWSKYCPPWILIFILKKEKWKVNPVSSCGRIPLRDGTEAQQGQGLSPTSQGTAALLCCSGGHLKQGP